MFVSISQIQNQTLNYGIYSYNFIGYALGSPIHIFSIDRRKQKFKNLQKPVDEHFENWVEIKKNIGFT